MVGRHAGTWREHFAYRRPWPSGMPLALGLTDGLAKYSAAAANRPKVTLKIPSHTNYLEGAT